MNHQFKSLTSTYEGVATEYHHAQLSKLFFLFYTCSSQLAYVFLMGRSKFMHNNDNVCENLKLPSGRG